MDWGLDEAILDAHCLTKTYNGHQGTDFVIRDFALMDSGVIVVAVDTGVVIFKHDGEFDREKGSDPTKGLGNYIGISHRGDYQSYYGHLRKNNILVSVGDTVLPGQPIGLIGSSGNSTDPHLHFELWYDSLYIIDPFTGPCGNEFTFWKEELAFDTSFHQWSSGLCAFIPDIDTLRERPDFRDTFVQTDQAITFWNLMFGLRTGDKIRVDWLNPGGAVWYSDEHVLDQDWWYYYYWSWIVVPDVLQSGQWEVRCYRNDELVGAHDFWLTDQVSSFTSTTNSDGIRIIHESDQIVVLGDFHRGSVISLMDFQGRIVRQINAQEETAVIPIQGVHSGLWLLRISALNGTTQNFTLYLPEN